GQADHGHDPVRTQIGLIIKLDESSGIVRRRDHAGEGAVRPVQPADQIQLPLPCYQAAREAADEHFAVIGRQIGLMLKVVATANIRSDDLTTGARAYNTLCVRNKDLQRHVRERHHLTLPGIEIELRGISPPLHLQNAQRLIDRQKLSADLPFERQRLVDYNRLGTRLRLRTMRPYGAMCGDPSERNQYSRGHHDDRASEPARTSDSGHRPVARVGLNAMVPLDLLVHRRPATYGVALALKRSSRGGRSWFINKRACVAGA